MFNIPENFFYKGTFDNYMKEHGEEFSKQFPKLAEKLKDYTETEKQEFDRYSELVLKQLKLPRNKNTTRKIIGSIGSGVKTLGKGIASGTRKTGNYLKIRKDYLKGPLASKIGKGIASRTRKVGKGIASRTRKVGQGILSGTRKVGQGIVAQDARKDASNTKKNSNSVLKRSIGHFNNLTKKISEKAGAQIDEWRGRGEEARDLKRNMKTRMKNARKLDKEAKARAAAASPMPLASPAPGEIPMAADAAGVGTGAAEHNRGDAAARTARAERLEAATAAAEERRQNQNTNPPTGGRGRKSVSKKRVRQHFDKKRYTRIK